MTVPTFPTRSRRRTYTGVVAAVGAVLTASLAVPVLFGHVPDGGSAPLAQALATSAPGGPSAADPVGASVAPVAGAAASSAPGVDAPAAAAASVPRSGGSGSSSASATRSGAPAAGAPAAGAPGAPASRRTASDVGVTRDTVTLGVFLIDLQNARRAGVNVDAYDPEKQKVYWNAFLKDVNSRGGVRGRTVRAVYRNIDLLDNSTFTAQCKQITETDHAFAVTNILGFYGPPVLCITRDHRTPWLAYDGLVSSYYTASQGRAFTVSPSTLRTELNLAARLEQSGELTDAAGKPKVIGYLHEDGYLNADNRAVMRWLEARGHTVIEGLHSSSSSTNAATDLQIAAQKICAGGATAVFLATNAIYGPQFVRDVGTQPGCRPSYLTSDFDFEMAGDTFVNGTGGMPAQYFDRALAVTASRVGEGRVKGYPEPAEDARCRRLFETAPGGSKLDRNSTADANYYNVLAACSLVQSFVAGLEGAGDAPTREGFSAALARRGSFGNPGFGASSFAPGRTDAPTQVRIAQATRDCGGGRACWKPLEGFRPAAY